jgi:predicted nucleic acid-binding protein
VIENAPLFVLDSFALLAFFQAEPGGLKARELLERAQRGEVGLAITTVNVGEVAYRTERVFGLERAQEVLAKIEEYAPAVIDVDRELALAAAHLKARYRMSYADCLAAALAQRLGVAVITGDPDFRQLEDQVAVEWLSAAEAQ